MDSYGSNYYGSNNSGSIRVTQRKMERTGLIIDTLETECAALANGVDMTDDIKGIKELALEEE